MKNLLNRKFTFKSLAIIVLVALIAGTAAGAATQTVQATLATDVTIRYDGEVQRFTDSNGDRVFPLMFRGTTYLPLRAVSNMMNVPVVWDGASRTVSLGRATAGERSLFNASERHRDSHSRWSAIQGADNLPQRVDDFGAPMQAFTFGYRQTDLNSASTNLVLTLDRAYTEISLTWAVSEGGANAVYRMEMYNADTGVVISSVDLRSGAFADVTASVAGVVRLGFRGVRTSGSGSAYGWALNPMIK